MSKHRSERGYIDRKIEMVRNHRGAENAWPQWANILADEIEDLRADLSEAYWLLHETMEYYGVELDDVSGRCFPGDSKVLQRIEEFMGHAALHH
jgi:hypothetical protein